MGLDQVRVAATGAAADRPGRTRVHRSASVVPVLRGLGHVGDCLPSSTMNPPDGIRIGSVGKVVPGGRRSRSPRTASCWCRGPLVMRGYRNDPEKTAEAIDSRRLDAHRRHRHDRRRGLRPDRRPQEGADHQRGRQEHVARRTSRARSRSPARWSAERGRHRRRAALRHRAARRWTPTPAAPTPPRPVWPTRRPPSSRQDERSWRLIRPASTRPTPKLSRVEQIKKFAILPVDWEPGGDELTPTMKLKRKPIAEKYAAEIDALYSGGRSS